MLGIQWVVFEGDDGVGKSTQVKMLTEYYRKRGIEPLVCHQPGGTKLGNILRTILLSDEYNGHLCPEAERLLFAADNAQFVIDVIIPALSEGRVIIQDRYTPYSNFAYGVHGNGVDREFMQIMEIATLGYYPDLVFLLDLDPEVAQQRITLGGDNKTRIDKLDLDFHKRVREGYLELSDIHYDRFRIIDASKNVDLVHSQVVSILEQEEKERRI